MEKVWKLREKLVVCLNGKEDYRAHTIQDLFWLASLAYLVDIVGRSYVLNIILKGCGIDIFEATSKLISFKEKKFKI